MNRRLYRSVADRRIGGVAAGTATYFDIDPSIARVLWLLLAIFTGGAFVIVYLVMWMIVPEEPWVPAAAPAAPAGGGDGGEVAPGTGETTAPAEAMVAVSGPGGESGQAPAPAAWPPQEARASSGPGGHVILGAILVLIGGWFLVREFLPGLNFDLLWPIGLVIVGVLFLVAAMRRGG